jgi:hypothetical protein
MSLEFREVRSKGRMVGWHKNQGMLPIMTNWGVVVYRSTHIMIPITKLIGELGDKWYSRMSDNLNDALDRVHDIGSCNSHQCEYY